MAKKKKDKKQTASVVPTDQKEYSSPGVETLEAMEAGEVAKSLSPAKLASLVSESRKGNSLAMATLALEMREEDPSFGGNLRTRKLAILNQPRSVIGENPKAAELIQQFLDKRYFTKLLLCLAEAVEIGYAVIELVWNPTPEGHWLPSSVHRIDPRRIGFDPAQEKFYWRNFDDAEDRKNLIDTEGADSLRYVVYYPDDVLMPNRGGLARLAAYAFMAKRFSLNDWVKFLSSAGMPLRVGRYEPTASSEQRMLLKRALQSLSSDKAAAIPKNTEIQFIESQNREGASFKNLADYLDKQLALAVLGQTLTSGTGQSGSYALGQVHNDIRMDILRADCISITAEIQELVEKICAVNFGPDSAPHISIKPKIQKDLQKLSGVVSTLSLAGAQIPLSWVYEEFGIPEPKEGEKCLLAPTSPAEKNKEKAEPNSLLLAELNSVSTAEEPSQLDELDELDEINDAALEFDYQPSTENAVLEALNSSADFDQFRKKLAKIAVQEPNKGLTQSLALAATKAALHGENDA